MKQQRALRFLTPLIGFLSFTATCAGLFWPGAIGSSYPFTTLRGQQAEMFGRGLYQYDSVMVGSGFKGTDLLTLLVALPLLTISYRGYRRNNVKSGLLMAGVAMFFLYNGISMSFAAAYNPFFLVYVALMSTSLFTFILILQALNTDQLGKHLSDAMPRSVMAAYFIIAGAGVLFLWGSEIAASWQTGLLPNFLAPYTTMVTHGLDMGIIAPTAFIVASMLRRGDSNAVRYGYPLAVLNILIGLTVISQTVMQLHAGVEFSTGQLIGMIGSWIFLAGFAAWTIGKMGKSLKMYQS